MHSRGFYQTSLLSVERIMGKRFENLFWFSANNSLDVFHFEGEGLQFRGKLIGIKDVEEARGDEMCQSAMTELVKSLKQSKEHKPRINISVSLAGLKIKDDKGTVSCHLSLCIG